MEIKIFSTGCPTCEEVFNQLAEVIAELELEVKLEKIEDLATIIKHGIMSVPALMINGKIVFMGEHPTKEELRKYLLEVK
ncbi:MAG: thioredoxin family protein [Bacilli bacterium]|jgi:small redox-active disulfide protein 2